MSLLIHNVTIFTNDAHNTVLHDQAVVTSGVGIAAVGPESELLEQYPDATRLNGQGRLLMPGWINAHMHFYSTFSRGLALPQAPQNFADILSLLWWKLDASLDPEAVYYSALIPAITAAKKGVTAIIDHHASAHAIEGSLDQIEQALKDVGLRGVLCYETSDRDGLKIAQQGLAENERYIRKCQMARSQNPDHPFAGLFGLHASFTLSNETLAQAGALGQALDTGFHIHLAEDSLDWARTLEKYQVPLGERLQEAAILGPKTITAHCIHLTESEKSLLAETDTIVAHTPQSNMNNAVGRTDITGLLERNILLGLGTDGMSPDLKPDIRTANLLHKHDLNDNNVGWQEVAQMALKNNPRIYERVSGQKVGQIAAGFLADLILVDYFPPTLLTGDNFWGHVLFGIADADVHTTIANGQIVMQAGQVAGLDEAEIAAKARQVAQRVWERFYAV